MITLEKNYLFIRFPEVHEDAVCAVSFQRTLRIPDDGKDYPLPPGLGNFPLHHVEDFEEVPERWKERGGVLMPMYQSEALWLSFESRSGYPMALQIAAGKVNAVNGEPWSEELQFEPQGYIVVDEQPWLDGFCVGPERIRQFVATPLGGGATVEEQTTSKAEHGGIQIKAWPLKAEVWEKLRPSRQIDFMESPLLSVSECSEEMGLGMGGSMRQQIFEDPFEPSDWEQGISSRCFVHLLNSEHYARATGYLPPHRPYDAADYAQAGLPWFDFYQDKPSVEGREQLSRLKTVDQLQPEGVPRPVEVAPTRVVDLSKRQAPRGRV